jgi:hemoglobin
LIKRDISNRADIELLVNTFYDRIRQNEKIGFYFNETIDDWDSHLKKISDFWDTQLLNARNFRGNPRVAHIKVDNDFNHEITTKEFGEWLNLWFQTIDELFKGEVAQTAKERARKMSTHLFMNMYRYRNIDA